jgi:hypothetical protein
VRRPAYRLLAGLAFVATAVVPTRAGGATEACGGRLRTGRWTAVTAPARPLVALAQDDGDACHLIAASSADTYVTLDGGGHWTRTELPAHGAITGLVSEGLGAGASLMTTAPDAAAPGTLWLSTDGGLSYGSVGTGTAPGTVLAAVTAPGAGLVTSDTATVYLLVRDADGSTLYVSTDSARTFLPLPDASRLGATRLAVDPTDAQVVWLNATTPGRTAPLWRSTDSGQTFGAVTVDKASDVYDVVLAPRPDGVVEATAATPGGLFVSDSDGARWWRADRLAQPSTAVRTELADYRTSLLLAGGVPYRGRRSGDFQPLLTGLQSRCGATVLAMTPTVRPAVALRCTDGTYYRLADAAPSGGPPEFPPGDPNSPATATGDAVPLVPVQTWTLPHAATGGSVTRSSGTIAFDGRTLYYLGEGDPADIGTVDPSGTPQSDPEVLTVYRISAKDGRELPPLALRIGKPPRDQRTDLAYDARDDALLILTGRGVDPTRTPDHAPLQVVAYDVARGTFARRFWLRQDTGIWPFVEPDPSTGGYTDFEDNTPGLVHRDADFNVVDTCQNPEVFATDSVAGMTAAGDGGGAYVEEEDDHTIIRLDAHCRTIRTYVHRVVSEALSEDDALACDGQDFPLPALWLRDAAIGSVTAYLAPGAFCPLPSALRVTAPRVVGVGGDAVVCATLGAASTPRLAGQRVSLAVDGRQLGYPPTDASGTACATYRADTPGPKPVVARFFGRHATPQLLPSTATTALLVAPGVVPVPPHPPAGPGGPVLPGVAGAAQPPAAPPAPPAQPIANAQPQPNPQAQSQTQGQAQSQGQGNPQAGFAERQQDSPRLAYAGADDAFSNDLAFSRRAPSPAALPLGAALVAAAAAALRRRTQHREATQRWR